jgi:uncharacterized protein YbjT (DUF2867 family)
MILLTGATGKTGFAAAKALSAAGKKARVITRDVTRAEKLTALGHEIAVGDLGDPAFVARAMSGIDQAFLLTINTERQADLEFAFVNSAKACGVRHIVKISSIEAHPGIGARVPEMHAASEAHIKASGLDWTIVKPNFFMQTLLAASAGIKARGELVMPVGEVCLSMIDCRDAGEIVAKVLIEAGHEGQSYKLTGPEALSFSDVAAHLTKALGRPISYVNPPLAAYRENLLKALPDPWRVDAVCEIFALTSKRPAEIEAVTDTFQTLTGRAPTTLATFIADYKQAF